jgi:hypothetical protein
MTQETEETEPLEGKPSRHNLLRIGRLTNLRQIAIECGRLYRRAAKGLISSGDASKQASILAVMKSCIEASDTEQRLEALEKAAAEPVATPLRRSGALPDGWADKEKPRAGSSGLRSLAFTREMVR